MHLANAPGAVHEAGPATDAALYAPVFARYVEVHMEQGPVLDELGVPLAPVSAIAGQTRLAVAIAGSQASID